MKLRDLYEKEKENAYYIGIYKGKNQNIYPDYADEMLETHGDLDVKEYVVNDGVLVVSFNENKYEYNKIMKKEGK